MKRRNFFANITTTIAGAVAGLHIVNRILPAIAPKIATAASTELSAVQIFDQLMMNAPASMITGPIGVPDEGMLIEPNFDAPDYGKWHHVGTDFYFDESITNLKLT